ncbi:MAG TPA: HAD-IA family hydrolase [Acidimicrobiales bacterium]|jgi:putative hydrolase of the HAD superfamily|nr:HAD-IA family hydrolase [Acidimicrobiales bacterium]
MEKAPVKAVLWDFGGVITTSPFDAFNAYEATNGLEPGFIRRLNSTNPDTNAWARFERSEVSAAEFAALFEAEAEAAGGQVEAAILLASLRGQIRPAMVTAIRRCRDHAKTALLTNNFIPPEARRSVPDTEGGYGAVIDLFDVVVESSKVGFRKPDPRFYEMALEMLAVDPTEAVFLDDLGVNLKPARALGIRTIKVVDPDQALADLEAIVGFPVRE